MTAVFLLERKTVSAWRKRYAFPPASAYERAARRGFSKQGKNISEPALLKKISAAKLLIVGDDRLVAADREKMISLLKRAGWARKPFVLVTDRERSKLWPGDLNAAKKTVTLPADLRTADRRLAAEAISQRARGNRVIVWTGALRASPPMLPAFLGRAGVRPVSVCLEAAEARWKSDGRRSWSELAPETYAWLERSPLLALEMFRNRGERGKTPLDPDQLETVFWETVRLVAAKVQRKLPPKPRGIFHPFDPAALEKWLKRKMDPRVKKFLLERMARGESAVIPSARLVWLATLDRGHLAEEAAHYVRLAGARGHYGPAATALEEALAFLASTWTDPDRKPPAGTERGGWSAVHRRGYRLGAKLAGDWKRSKKSRAFISAVWKIDPRPESFARRILSALETQA